MIIIPSDYKSFEFIRTIEWAEVFAIWKKSEAQQESWRKHWEERGFDSWEEWRMAYAGSLEPGEKEWFLYEIKNPLEEFSKIYGAPTRNWIDMAYNGKKTKLLSDILDLPMVVESQKIQNLRKDFPSETTLTGIVWGDKIAMVEGMGRSLALAGYDKNKEFNSTVKMALAVWDEEELPVLGGNWKNRV